MIDWTKIRRKTSAIVSPIDWASMTDADLFAAAMTIPSVGGPWERGASDEDGAFFRRENPRDGSALALIVLYGEGEAEPPGWYGRIFSDACVDYVQRERFDSLEDAQTKIDRSLRDGGWRLA